MDLNFINFFQPVFWIKIITLIVIGFYVIFTFVIFTQVKVMAQILHLPNVSGVLKIISIIHVILAISLFLLAIVILQKMDNNISFSKIVATPTLNSWSQAYNAGKLFAVLSLERIILLFRFLKSSFPRQVFQGAKEQLK